MKEYKEKIKESETQLGLLQETVESLNKEKTKNLIFISNM